VANHKSSKKRSKQTIKKNHVNTVRSSEVKSMVKKVREAIENKDKAAAVQAFPSAQKLIAKLAKAGVIKLNTAARKISRLSSQINGL